MGNALRVAAGAALVWLVTMTGSAVAADAPICTPQGGAPVSAPCTFGPGVANGDGSVSIPVSVTAVQPSPLPYTMCDQPLPPGADTCILSLSDPVIGGVSAVDAADQDPLYVSFQPDGGSCPASATCPGSVRYFPDRVSPYAEVSAGFSYGTGETIRFGQLQMGPMIGNSVFRVPLGNQHFVVSGRVTRMACGPRTCSRKGIAGVLIKALPGTAKVRTNLTGRYSIRLQAGTYTIKPTSPNDAFAPVSTQVALTAAKAGVDFEACSTLSAVRSLRAPLPRSPAGCGVKLDWKMPDRLTLGSGVVWPNGLPSAVDVYPGVWNAELFVSRKGVRVACPRNVRFRWKVVAPAGVPGARVLSPRTPVVGCSVRMLANRLGAYAVTATKQVRRNGRWVVDTTVKPFKRTALLRDWLIVGVGDSNGSGEGNPDSFYYERCNRGTASYQYQTALYVEQQDPHSSVTFIHTSCSGARIQHFVDTPYAGTRAGAVDLVSQSQQIRHLLSENGNQPRRKVDIAITSLGVNDIAFGPILSYCVKTPWPATDCQDQNVDVTRDSTGFPSAFSDGTGATLGQWLATLQNGLVKRYTGLSEAMTSIGVKPKRVFLAQYPDFARGPDGLPCDTHLLSASIARWTPATWGWLSDNSRILDGHVRDAAAKYGWTAVPVLAGAFAERGYCAGANSLFVGIGAAVAGFDVAGPFHPDAEAHMLAAIETRRLVCRALYPQHANCKPV